MEKLKNGDIDEPTSFLDHVYLGCTQRECKPNGTNFELFKKLFESRISAGATAKQAGKSLTRKLQRGLTTWKDMLKHALSHTGSWHARTWSNFAKFQVSVWMIINSRRSSLNQLENCHKYAHKLSSNACTWRGLEDLTFFWSANSRS